MLTTLKSCFPFVQMTRKLLSDAFYPTDLISEPADAAMNLGVYFDQHFHSKIRLYRSAEHVTNIYAALGNT